MKCPTLRVVFSLIVFLSLTFLLPSRSAQAQTTPVDLLTAEDFTVLAGSAVTGTGTNVVTGDVGLSPGTGAAITLLTCAEVSGTIYDVDGTYTGGGGGSTACLATNAGLLTQAKNDLTTAFNDAAGRTPATTLAGSDNQLGGQTLTDGVYTFGAASTANLIGTLTLDAEGNSDAVFIFQATSTFITGSSSVVELENGAQACNVFWQVATSATLGTGTDFVGTIMADQSITDNGGSTVDGRFLARVAAVTLNNTTISQPTCVVPTATPTPTPTPVSGSSSSSTSTSNSSSSSGGGTGGAGPCIASEITTVPTIIESRRVSPTSVFISWGPNAGLDRFNIRYGLTNGEWLYNTDVTGFSTTINDLPPNQPIWIQVAARNECAIGPYGPAKLVGAARTVSLVNPLIPGFPNTGFAPVDKNISREIFAGIFLSGVTFYLVRRVYARCKP